MKRPDRTPRIAAALGVRVVPFLRKPKPTLPDMFREQPAAAEPMDTAHTATKRAIKEIEQAMLYNVAHVPRRGHTTGERKSNGRGAEAVEAVEDDSFGAHPKSILGDEAVDLMLGAGLIEHDVGFNRYCWMEKGVRAVKAVCK